jgi:hypothetical protein
LSLDAENVMDCISAAVYNNLLGLSLVAITGISTIFHSDLRWILYLYIYIGYKVMLKRSHNITEIVLKVT